MRKARVLTQVDGIAHTVSDREFLLWAGEQTADEGVALDTETAGLGWRDEVRLVQFGSFATGYAVDVRDEEGVFLVKTALDLYHGPLIFHNSNFDIRQLTALGMDPERIWPRAIDTHVMAHVLDSDRISFQLDALIRTYLLTERSDWKKSFRKSMRKHKWTWADVPLLALAPYGIEDTALTHQLYHYMVEHFMDDPLWDVVYKEMDVRWAMWTVEQRGMKLDRQYAECLKANFEHDLAEDRQWFMEEFGIKNPNANAQLITALQESGWVPTAFTEKTGKPKLDKSVMKDLVGKFPLVDRLTEYKRKGKWLAAYVDNCLEQADDAGYVHASYNSLGAKTGRMSCSNPPLQQLPKGGGGEIRRLFVPSDGNVLASVDYSAIELRLAGALSGERGIISVYEENGDIYQAVADSIGCTRAQAKVVVLASLYGAGGPKIAAGLGITDNEGRKLVLDFWDAYPTLHRWVRNVMNAAQSGDDVRSMWGRPLRPHSAYAAPNAIIQGTAAEVMKDGILRLWQENLLQYVVAVVHDEVVLDVPTAEAEDLTTRVSSVLRDDRFLVPLVAEGEVYGDSWGAGYV